MYAEFYGLCELPFQLTPDPRFFFDSSGHRQALSHLTYGVHSGEGFIVVTGDVGAGKTTVVEHLLSGLETSNYSVAKIVTTQLDGDDLLRVIAGGFGIVHASADKATLLRRIEEFIISQRQSGKRALLIVDEAQNLSFAALEELRMLSNIIVDRISALQTFLLGQPQFRASLASPALEQLRQRVIAAYHLGPLSFDETQAYIEHRLRRASWNGDPAFASGSFPIIYRHTAGIPRRINLLCSRLLLFGFLEELHHISEENVERIAHELGNETAQVSPQPASPSDRAAGLYNEVSLDELTGRMTLVERRVKEHGHRIKTIFDITLDLARRIRDEPY
jgi:general secretion pathway protein A